MTQRMVIVLLPLELVLLSVLIGCLVLVGMQLDQAAPAPVALAAPPAPPSSPDCIRIRPGSAT